MNSSSVLPSLLLDFPNVWIPPIRPRVTLVHFVCQCPIPCLAGKTKRAAGSAWTPHLHRHYPLALLLMLEKIMLSAKEGRCCG